jgi:hypothetical protein
LIYWLNNRLDTVKEKFTELGSRSEETSERKMENTERIKDKEDKKRKA